VTAKVVELLREAVRDKKPDDFVLTRKGNKPIRDMRDAWQSLCTRAGLGNFVCSKCGGAIVKKCSVCGEEKKCKRCKVRKQCAVCAGRGLKYVGLIPHDLRRSAAKAARRAGVPESVVMQMGGWLTAAVFRRYAIVSSADQRAAVEMLERARAGSKLISVAIPGETAPAPATEIEQKVQ